MPQRLAVRALVAAGILTAIPLSMAQAQEAVAVRKEGVRVVRADISPPLRSIPIQIVQDGDCGLLMADPGEIPEQKPETESVDPVLQDWTNWLEIPSPTVSFDGPPNLCGCSPPDPNGAVGLNHFVTMDNLHFAIYDKTGTLLLGPTANTALWTGFGGNCETSNDGDPVVLYDQLADRWLLTQFALAGSPDNLCVALSTSGDPTGTYQRYAIASGEGLPDYPKWGVWPDGYYLSARITSPEHPVVWTMDRMAMLGGSLSPVVIGFSVTPGSTPAYNYGNGLLPSDLDGFTLPPAGSPNYFIGSMDDGGPLGAPQDALTVWEFHADFVTPGNSSFTFTGAVPVSSYDTIFPCSGRNCIPQPATANRLDHLGYRQRPLFRAAYRNFGSHESIVTNQSVEATTGISGIRWWELRDPGGSPTIFQEGTFGPGATDGIHRWMGSIAMDSSGNMGLGYSAADDNSPAGGTFPSVWYTGRLVSDPPGMMSQGEGSIFDGTGSQTSSQRWGDYTSLTLDPTDDCTFWFTNEYIPVTSGSGWQLRVGAFRFAECGSPDFTISPDPLTQAVCAPSNAVYTVNVGSISGFTDNVTLSASGNPSGTSVGFSTNPVTPPGSSTMTVSGTGGATPGSSTITITGTAPGPLVHTADVGLDIVGGTPAAPTLISPADGASGVSTSPTLTWSAVAGAADYLVEVDDDPGFGSPEFSTTTSATSVAASGLVIDTTYNWRVTASNICGPGSSSSVFTFTTGLVFCRTVNLPIPDNSPTGVTDTLSLPPGALLISDLNVSVTMQPDHTFLGDLIFRLGKASTTIDLIDRPGIPTPGGAGCSANLDSVTLDDEGSTPIESPPGCSTTATVISGVFTPNEALSAFNNDPIGGSWTLSASDNAAGDTGTIVQWCLIPQLFLDTMPFLDGFESGDTSAWSVTVP